MSAMDRQVEDLLRSLQIDRTDAAQSAGIRDWVAVRDVDRLRELAFALAKPRPAEAPRWAGDSALFDLVRELARTSDANFAALIRDLARRGAPAFLAPAYLACLVASGQSFDIAASLVAGAGSEDDEFVACLVQEMALCHQSVELESIASHWRQLDGRGHPLTWLPLCIAKIERGVEYRGCSISCSASFGPTDEAQRQPETAFRVHITGDITSTSEVSLASSAFRNWLENSNGKVDLRVFELAADCTDQPVADALGAARLDCVVGADVPHVEDVSARDAFSIVFSAASHGGAYSSGRRGAYGRLEAWKTLAALAGSAANAPFESVSAAVNDARWFRFESDAPWFYGVAWDVGLVALRKDKKSLAVLAATDTD